MQRARPSRARFKLPPTSPQVSPTASGICDLIQTDGDEIILNFIRGVITIEFQGTRFEFFSATRSQGCDQHEWIQSLRKIWMKSTPIRREAFIKKLGKEEFSARELLNVINSVPQTQT